MADNIDRDWNEMCNNLKDVIQTQVTFVHSISEKLQSLEIGTGSGGVGEWIEPGTQYTYQGTTYTVGTNVERFNLYGDDGVIVNQAAGSYSHVEGYNNKALGGYSHAEGNDTKAIGGSAHSEGNNTEATGIYSHAEGSGTKATNLYSHAEGNGTEASGDSSHAEGYLTIASGTYAHAEGEFSKATAYYSHAEGSDTEASGAGAHAEGHRTKATESQAHAEGLNTVASGFQAHAEGCDTLANGSQSHAEGNNTHAIGERSHSEGCDTEAIGNYSHAEGYGSKAPGYYSHAEGNNTIAAGSESHAEGVNNTINSSASDAHVEGFSNTVSGFGAHAEGGNNTIGTNANSAHAEGYSNIVTASYAHVEGYSCDVHGANAHAEGCDTLATGVQSHAEGNMTQAHGAQSHAEGSNTVCAGTATSGHAEGHASVAIGDVSHAQNESTRASGSASTAMGDNSVASGSVSTAMGYYTIANGTNQLALGKCNISDTNNTFAMIIGNGIDDSNRSDAFKVDWDGKIYVGNNNNGVDVSGLYVTSADNNKVLTASYQNGVGTYSWQDAPESGVCVVHTYTDTSLPNKVVLDNNNEYRYINLTSANSLTISIETIDTTKSFYSTIVLHNVSSTNSLSTFVTVSGDSVISNIIFLNENNVDLSTADTAELLFFTNGMSNTVMCIAYAYGTPTPPTPPTPSYDESKILVIELDANHDDTTNITEHTTLLSAKNQLDTNYSTDPSKMYKLFIGDDAFDPKIGIENGAFEDSLNLYSAIIGESIIYLAGAVFYNCSNLTYLQVPYSMKSFVGYNITGTNLPSLTVHSNFISMTGLGDYIFYDNNLTDLTIDATGTVYLAIDDSGNNDLYSDVFGSASYMGDTSGGTPTKPITINFGENVTGIVANTEGYIFGYNNQYGVTVNIPNSVTSISDSFLLGISDLVGNITLNIDNTNGAIPGAPWGAGSASNLTIKYLR